MWGYGGKYYWRKRNNQEGGGGRSVVVVFAWMSSEERNLKNHVDLYDSLLWDSLVCHSPFLNMFLPDKAANLASDLVSELVKVGDEDLKAKPVPLVFASFSGVPNACMYKVLQILKTTCETGLSQDDCRFESQRAEFWQTLYSTITMRVPYLILCSENDDLPPYQTIHNVTTRLQELGGNVKLVKWNDSPHVGHDRRREAMKEETPCDDEISAEPTQQTFGGLGTTSGLNRSFNGTLLVTTDHFFVPSTVGYYVGNDGGSVQDELKQNLIRLSSAQNEDKDVLGPMVCLAKSCLMFITCLS
ncbi:hypothetical protein Bca4012_025781 [Brassica carinata]